MFKRDLINQMREWSNRSPHKPLVIRGARQVGKSTLVRQFGSEFDVFIEVNLEQTADARIFQQTDDVIEIWKFLCLRNNIVSDSEKRTLLFIDEIQEVPQAISLLRYFYEKMPWLHVITAGSRLQSLLKDKGHESASRRTRIAFPVSRVEYLNLRPFSFTEYVRAMEGEDWVNLLQNLEVSTIMHDRMTKLFNQYALVGGMPEVVANFAENQDIVALSPIFNSLLKGYSEDVEYYAKNENQTHIIRHILSTLWFSAAETITFANFGNSNYTSTQIHEAMECLEKAFLISLDYPITSTALPAIPNKRRKPKLITLDSGLTNFFVGIQTEYLQNKNLLDTWRGRAAEQIVAQELRVLLDRDFRDMQCYWIRDKNNTKAELDFIWQKDTQIIPIEVKAGTNSHFRSIHSFVNNATHLVTAIRIWGGEFMVQDVFTPQPDKRPYRLISIPFYYVGQLESILHKYLRHSD